MLFDDKTGILLSAFSGAHTAAYLNGAILFQGSDAVRTGAWD